MPQSLDNLSTTWTGSTVYTGIKFSALDSGSGASLMMDLRAGAAGTTSVFSVAKSGNITLGSGTGAPNVNIGSATTLNLLNLGVSTSGVGILGANEGNNRTSLFGNIAINGQTYLRSNVFLSWSNSTTSAWDTVDLTLGRDAANTLAQRNGTNAQTFRVYNTFTSDTSYERGKIEWASNVLRIGTEKGSLGGTARALELQTDGVTRLTVPADGSSANLAVSLEVLNSKTLGFSSSSTLFAPSNGVLRITNYAGTDFSRLQFGGTTSSYPSIKRSGTMLQARLADDSGFATLDGILSMEGTAPTVTGDTGTAGELRYDANYLYVCTAANTWKRVAIATW